MLWSNKHGWPAEEQLRAIPGQVDVVVEPGNTDRFRFLHDAAITSHRETLICGWYNCPEHEIVGESLIRGRRSSDGGRTWSDLEVIASDTSGVGIHYVPVQFLSHGGLLYAFVGKMHGGHDLIRQCALFVSDEESGRWSEIGEIAELFLPNCEPVLMDDGNFILPGRVAAKSGKKPLIAAVAISQGREITKPWRVVPLHEEETPAGNHPETTVIVDGCTVTAFVRDNSGNLPCCFRSRDGGCSWSEWTGHGFAATPSKLYAGRLSTGQSYVAFNYPRPSDEARILAEKGRFRRAVLALAVSDINATSFTRIWKIRDDAANGPAWSAYPAVHEHGGKLFIAYTACSDGRRQCALSIVPVSALRLT